MAWVKRGFFFVEADVLKNIPLNAPYAALLANDRVKIVKQGFKKGWTPTKFKQTIAHLYEVRGWKQPRERLHKSNIYRMVRDYEQIWKNTSPPDEVDKWISPSAKKSHHGTSINRDKLRAQKRIYNARPEVREKRRLYRLKHRPEIREAERKRREFIRTHGQPR